MGEWTVQRNDCRHDESGRVKLTQPTPFPGAYYTDFFKRPDGTFKRWVHGVFCGQPMGTIHGEQYLPPSVMHPPGAYYTDDFGDCFVIRSEAHRQANRDRHTHET